MKKFSRRDFFKVAGGSLSTHKATAQYSGSLVSIKAFTAPYEQTLSSCP